MLKKTFCHQNFPNNSMHAISADANEEFCLYNSGKKYIDVLFSFISLEAMQLTSWANRGIGGVIGERLP